MFYIVACMLCFIIGIFVGAFSFSYWMIGRIHGKLLITESDDGGLPYFSLDMSEYPHGIEKKKFVIFRTKVIK